MYKPFHMLFGFYRISVPSRGIDLINRLNAEKILFWDIKKRDAEVLLSFSVFSYGKGIAIANEMGIRYRLDAMRGLPFIVSRQKSRVGLIAGAVIGSALIMLSTMFVWEIQVIGCENVSKNTVLTALRENGLHSGRMLLDICCKQVAVQTVCSVPELSSVAINTKGTYVYVKVLERRKSNGIYVPGEGTAHVVAGHDGHIEEIIALKGKAVVSKGDVVKKGDLLITGLYDGYTQTKIAVRADGLVLARAYLDYVCTVPLDMPFKEYSGKSTKKISYNMFGMQLNLFLDSGIPFDNFDLSVSNTQVYLLGLKLPAVRSELTATEYTRSTFELDVAGAEKKAIAAFNAWCEAIENGELLTKSYNSVYDPIARTVTLTGEAVVLRDIAVTEEFDPLASDSGKAGN